MTRVALPDRRQQLLFAFRREAIGFVGAVGFDAADRPAEVFLSCEKTTSAIEALGRDGAILISLALQHGCAFETMRRAVTREEDGAAATLIGQLLDEIEALGLAQALPSPASIVDAAE